MRRLQMKRYKSFVFGETMLEILNTLPAGLKFKFQTYIIEYGINGTEPEGLSGLKLGVWVALKSLTNNLKDGRGAPAGNRNAENPKDASDDEENKKNKKTYLNYLNSKKTNTPNININKNININENINENENLNKNIYINSEKNESETKKTNENEYKTNENEKNESENRDFRPALGEKWPPNSDEPRPPDYALEFQELREIWNNPGRKTPLPPFRRDFLSLTPAQREAFVQARQNFSPAEIINAVKNYQYLRDTPEEYTMAHNYASIFTFLEKGVGTFYLDDVIDAQFLRKERK
jgi:hypothetical protein